VSVIDASVFVDALVGVGVHGELARQEVRSQPIMQVPAIFGAESTSVLRGLVLRGHLSAIRAVTALGKSAESGLSNFLLAHPGSPWV
jgi:hypothetical protein